MPAARAGTANAGLRGAVAANPLAGMRWGHYTGSIDGVYPAYQAATGRERALLAKIALEPLAYWFGAWYSEASARAAAAQYIAQDTGGNPDELAQLTVFRLDPWEAAACSSTPNAAQQGAYEKWIDDFAAGIGTARVALILQPDLPFALCAPSRTPLELVAYATARFSALPHTTVYIDAGAAYWTSPARTARLLRQAGIGQVRGFALNATQYDSTANELRFGAQIERRLGRLGITGKHLVINTAENGAPFLYGQYRGNRDNPRVCRDRTDTVCATLGIPPTWHVTDRRWRLSARARALAARYADAYLWIGRPWLDDGSWPLDLGRALGLASSSPF
ncbi:MAG: glycoside hydrolase family 6 protein [Solirubrobacterales bacterium]|nr:glycoside hydrolase family 6 protein [Solirubrobacterales bacterium]